MSFFLEYLKHPAKIGAIVPSGKWLAKKMVESIHFEKCNCIVEYGPGTGVFTEEIIKRKRLHTTFMVIEQNKSFYKRLEKKFANVPNLILINGDAGDIEKYMVQYQVKQVEYIVSGLPFTSLPKSVSETILNATNKVIGKRGRFITFQYTLLKRDFFEQYFRIGNIAFELKNIPPAYVFVMENKFRTYCYD